MNRVTGAPFQSAALTVKRAAARRLSRGRPLAFSWPWAHGAVRKPSEQLSCMEDEDGGGEVVWRVMGAGWCARLMLALRFRHPTFSFLSPPPHPRSLFPCSITSIESFLENSWFNWGGGLRPSRDGSQLQQGHTQS